MEDQFGLPGAGEVNVHFHLPILLFFFFPKTIFFPLVGFLFTLL